MVEALINAESIQTHITSDEPESNKLERQCLPKGVETGDKWDEILDLFDQGVMNINFYNNMIGYTAGDCVSGTIDIMLNQPIDCSSLEIEFIGVERTHLKLDGVIRPKVIHRETKEIIRLHAQVQD